MIAPIRQTLSLPNIQLSYLEWNAGRQPLLLLHGVADSASVWLSLGNQLADHYHIIAPDLRGHGESEKPETGYSFADAIADLEKLLDHLGWSSAHTLGHSWSAKLLLIWAKENPERLRSLMLVDPIFINQMPNWIKLTFPLLYRTLPFLRGMGPFPSYEVAEEQIRQLKQYRGWSELQQQVFHAGIEEKPDHSWGSKFTLAARDRIFAEMGRVAGLTQPINIPTLFLQPETGINRTEWQLKPYRTYLKNLQICKVPGHHWPFLIEPEAFNQAVEAFLDSQK